jgi:cellulose synthase/poly-beta-1,6-N-acetylglucosamine synthase-like glycosyltransferase
MTAVQEPGPARVAVIVPCVNDGKTVRDTIESVTKSEPVELVVVDDGSDDPATRHVLPEGGAGRLPRLQPRAHRGG